MLNVCFGPNAKFNISAESLLPTQGAAPLKNDFNENSFLEQKSANYLDEPPIPN